MFAANGSNEVIQTLLLAYAGAGRTVVVFEPTYQLHRHIARITGATVVAGERRDDFTLDPDDVASVLARTDPAVTFLCSPNNPTGVIESPEVLERRARRRAGWSSSTRPTPSSRRGRHSIG